MNRLLAALVLAAASAGSALAASVTNTGAEPVILIVVEDGNRMEVAIDAGATQAICPGGCFVTLPNGDRLGLEGQEKVEISNGAASVK